MNPLAKLFNMAQEAKASVKAINDEWDAYMNEVDLAWKKHEHKLLDVSDEDTRVDICVTCNQVLYK